MPLEELEPLELDFCPASHSERLSCPSWFLSSLSNSLLELEDDVPPAAELGLDEDELGLDDDDVPPAEDDEGEDDLSLCDVDGEVLVPDELFESPAA